MNSPDASPTPSKVTQPEHFDSRKDARKRAEAIRTIVAEGRANGHRMTFAERVAASYQQVAEGGER